MRSLSAFFIALAIIIAAVVLSKGYNYKFKSHHTLSVAGSAYYDFTADLIVWSGVFERTSMDIKDAYANLKTDEQNIGSYLSSHGIANNEMVFSAIVIDKQFQPTYSPEGKLTGTVFKGYKLTQSIKIESKNIDTVEKISRQITELLQSGIELTSGEPLYYYTKLADLKVDLLAKASADAYNRAQTVVKNAKGHLGKMINASMGVFQITGQYSNENFTYSGAYNTSSKNKTANVVVRIEYALD